MLQFITTPAPAGAAGFSNGNTELCVLCHQDYIRKTPLELEKR